MNLSLDKLDLTHLGVVNGKYLHLQRLVGMRLRQPAPLPLPVVLPCPVPRTPGPVGLREVGEEGHSGGH